MSNEALKALQKELEDDKNLFLVIDGGTGTEIERLVIFNFHQLN